MRTSDPQIAVSTSVTLAFGDMWGYTLDGSSSNIGTAMLTSARLHLGIVWFPRENKVALPPIMRFAALPRSAAKTGADVQGR